MQSPEQPRSEPEIIPPREAERRSWRSFRFGSRYPYVDVRRMQRIYVGRPGPLGWVLLGLAIGFAAALMLIALLGALLIWIPLLALLALAVLVSAMLRR